MLLAPDVSLASIGKSDSLASIGELGSVTFFDKSDSPATLAG